MSVIIEFNNPREYHKIGVLNSEEIEILDFLSQRFAKEDLIDPAHKQCILGYNVSKSHYNSFGTMEITGIPFNPLLSFTIRDSITDEEQRYKINEACVIEFVDDEMIEDGVAVHHVYTHDDYDSNCFEIDCDYVDFDITRLEFEVTEYRNQIVDDLFITACNYGQDTRQGSDNFFNVLHSQLMSIEFYEIEADKCKWYKLEMKYPLHQSLDIETKRQLIPQIIKNYFRAKYEKDILEMTQMVYIAPMLKNILPPEKIDVLWLTKENIQNAINVDLIDDIPYSIKERVLHRHPEWLI